MGLGKRSAIFVLLARLNELVRLISALIVFKFPLLAIILSFLLDTVDSPIYRFAGYKRNKYQLIDKSLDFLWYTTSLVYVLASELPYTGLLILLYGLRALGQILFYISKDEKYFIYFPNFYEAFFIVIFVATNFETLSFLISPDTFIKTAGVASILVILREFIAHKYDLLYYPYIPEFFKGPE